MTIKEAQKDMCKAYLGGGPGAFTSGIVWLIAGITAVVSTTQYSVLFFFFGGMMIHPVGILVSKALQRSGKHTKGNPLSYLALESTIFLFIGLFIAYLVLQIHPDWFFPIMILIIGGRYFVFSTIYGMRIYWIFGGTLLLSGIGGLLLNTPFYMIAFIGGAVEIIFSIVIFYMERRNLEVKID